MSELGQWNAEYHSPAPESDEEASVVTRRPSHPKGNWVHTASESIEFPGSPRELGCTYSNYSMAYSPYSPAYTARMENGDDYSQLASANRTEVPDHPCNYCHCYHYFSGPLATDCAPGTKVPTPDRHNRGHRSQRFHLPDTECHSCGQVHWYAGLNATPCPVVPSKGRTLEIPARSRIVAPKRSCLRCGLSHWLTGPHRQSCKKAKRAAHDRESGVELDLAAQRQDIFAEGADPEVKIESTTVPPTSPFLQDIRGPITYRADVSAKISGRGVGHVRSRLRRPFEPYPARSRRDRDPPGHV